MNNLNFINKWISPNSSVLDLGCGQGNLLEKLTSSLEIKGYGIEIGNQNIELCLEKGLNIIEQDIDEGLENIGTKSFDTVILSETIHVLKKPDQALKEITRIGKNSIVTIPNFAHWSSRISLLTKGRMPLSDSHPNSWYESENLHLCTLKDFEDLCNTLNIKILDRILISSLNRNSAYLNFLPNLLSYYAMYKLSD
tara:strand:- start:175 stop:762 length:588 start_codon:yes stop_codon:yes gene_type:complete